MRSLFLALILLALGTQAEAAKRVGFFSLRLEELSFAGETQFPDPEAPEARPLDLCILTTRRAVFGVINFWTTRNYVLAHSQCTTDEDYEFQDGMMVEARAEGLIDAGVPDAPPWTPLDVLKGFWGIGLGLGFFGMGSITAQRFKLAAKRRSHVLGQADTMGKRAGTAMAAAARADGRASTRQRAMIREVLNTLTADPLTEAEVNNVIKNTPKMKREQLEHLGVGVDLEDRMDLYQAAVLVTLVDSDPTGKERAFLSQLSRALRLNEAEAGTVYARALSSRETV